MPLRLTVVDGPAAGLAYALPGPGTVLVGRSSKAHLRFPSGPAGDLRVSHAHLLVTYAPPACRAYDLNSHNGTFVNGGRVAAADLRPGDALRVGRSTIRVELDPPPAETTDLPSAPPADPGTFDSPTVLPAPASLPPPAAVCPGCRKEPPAAGEPVCGRCRAAAAKLPQPAVGYLLLREVGRGGMGVVFKAVRRADRRVVAV